MNRNRVAAIALAVAALSSAPLAPILSTPASASIDDSASERFVREAEAHLEAGRARDAAIELKNALRENPNNARARYLLGKVSFESGDLAGAIKELKRAVSLSGDDDARILLAEAYLDRGEHEEALETASTPSDSHENEIRKLLVAGGALIGLSRVEEAEARFREALERDPRRVEAHYGLARVLLVRRNYDQAALKLQEIVEGKPDFAPGWMMHGELSLMRGDRHAAFQAFDKAAELTPDTIAPYVARARANLATGDLDAARRDAGRVAELAPDAPIRHYLDGAVAFAEGDHEAANSAYTQFSSHLRAFPPAVLLGALIKHQRGEYNQADSLLGRYIGMQPNDREALRALAVVRAINGNPSSSVDILTRLLADNPGDLGALRHLASAYLRMEEYEKARAAFEKLAQQGGPGEARLAENALLLFREDGPAATPELRRHLLRAFDTLTTGDIDTAERALEDAAALDAGHPVMLNLRAAVAMQRGDSEAAYAFLEQALQRAPDMAQVHNELDKLDVAAGREAAIHKRLDALLQKNPRNAFLSLRKAQRLAASGDRDGAADFLVKAARSNPDSIPVGRALVSALILQQRLPEAASEAERLAGVAGDDPSVLAFATNALIDAGAGPRAVETGRKLVRIAPDSARAMTMLAEAQAKAGDAEEARATLMQARDRWPENVGVAGALVTLALTQRDAAAAKEAADALSKHDPAAGARLTARAFSQLKQPGLAVEALERAFAENPDSRLAVDLYAARRRAGRDPQAFEGLRAWIDRNPRDGMALMTYATGMLESERYAEAEAAYREFLRLNPRNPIALNNFAWIRHKSGRLDALDYAERAYKASGGAAEIADTYGWMLVQYGKLKEGVSYLKSAYAAAPENPEIGYHYAYALSKTGQLREARGVLEEALSIGKDFNGRQDAEALRAVLR